MAQDPFLRNDWCPACGKARLLERGGMLRCRSCGSTFTEDLERRNVSPDVLSTLGEPGMIVERDGVHLAMSFQADGPVVSGSTHRIVIAVQNC